MSDGLPTSFFHIKRLKIFFSQWDSIARSGLLASLIEEMPQARVVRLGRFVDPRIGAAAAILEKALYLCLFVFFFQTGWTRTEVRGRALLLFTSDVSDGEASPTYWGWHAPTQPFCCWDKSRVLSVRLWWNSCCSKWFAPFSNNIVVCQVWLCERETTKIPFGRHCYSVLERTARRFSFLSQEGKTKRCLSREENSSSTSARVCECVSCRGLNRNREFLKNYH